MVAATVVSAGTGNGFVIDAGAKILAKDVSPYLAGHGAIVGYPEAVIHRLNDHHGVVDLPPGRRAAGDRLDRLGRAQPRLPGRQPRRRLPRGPGRRVVDRWPVDARGRNA